MAIFGLGGSNQKAALIEECYTLDHVPGKQIKSSLGLVEYTKIGITGDVPKLSEGIFQSLLQSAREKGANAVVNVRLVSGSYDAQGTKWQETYIIAYGDAVILD